MSKCKFHEDRLIAALKLTPETYYKKLDVLTVQNMVAVAGFSKEMEQWIWEKERKPFEVW